ncbi:hypothetical protein [Mangrovimonas futianensis]|uniref:hypothetical protein n=1 Tax=Mangrovimonas futianensis TaxID=2895523 RepID=UPI001E38A8FD|nr:hypothetical protein [Mangrovimonas futianensis]MCF1421881.1 hypothetical protein [Mangrovimonas futianensis]
MIVTPLDSAQLDSKEHYVFYHRMVDFVLKELIVSIQYQGLCTGQELTFFKQYCDLLLYSIEAMRIKYMFDDEEHMKVDLTDSGFPNYLEFRYLFNDLELRDHYLEKLTPIQQLEEEFLDTLLRKKQPVKRNRLFQAASIAYYKTVNKQYIFNRFVQGKIIEVEDNPMAKLMTSWSFYDVTHNRPFVCFMYFDYDGSNILEEKEEMYEALKQIADREMNLDTMAYAIDRKLPHIHPKQVKRIDLGPLHNIFAKDEHDLTHALLESIGKKEIPLESYAISLTVDEVFSKGEFKEGNFFNKQVLQNWSDVMQQKYVFAPHRVIQMLYNKTPDWMNGLAKPPIQMSSLPTNGD